MEVEKLLSKCKIRDFPGSPVVKISPSNAGGTCLIPGWGAKIPHASGPTNQNIKQKQYCNKLNKDLKWSTSKKSLKKKQNKRLTQPKKGKLMHKWKIMFYWFFYLFATSVKHNFQTHLRVSKLFDG